MLYYSTKNNIVNYFNHKQINVNIFDTFAYIPKKKKISGFNGFGKGSFIKTGYLSFRIPQQFLLRDS